jgi:sugar O-acyltransferase (sialic acid O-acetyltransferase NeuD family)
LFILGAGGHAKVVISTARAAGYGALACRDDAPGAVGRLVLGVPITGGLAEILDDPAALAVLAIGGNRARARLAAGARCQFVTLVHPRATVDPSAALGEGTVVFAGAVIQPDARLGRQVIVNTAASIDHDCVIGDHAHLAPGVHLCGGVEVGEGALLGVGVSAIPLVRIGAWTTVGAGAAVVRDLPADVTAAGVPARAR